MIALLVFVLVAFIVLRAGLRRVPLLTLACLGILGFGLHTRVIALPSAVARPVAHFTATVRAWQRAESARLVCAAQEASAVRNEDLDAIARIAQSCNASARPTGR